MSVGPHKPVGQRLIVKVATALAKLTDSSSSLMSGPTVTVGEFESKA